MKKDLLVIVSGGQGQNAMRTALTKELKEKYGSIYVVSPYVDVWTTQDLDGVYAEALPSLYQQLIQDNDNIDIIPISPYETTNFINKKEHFLDAYRGLFGLEKKGVEECMKMHVDMDVSKVMPNIYEEAEKVANDLLKEHNKKDICLIQSHGGNSAFAQGQDNQQPGIIRDYKYMQELVKLLQEKHSDTLFLQYKLPWEKALDGCVSIERPYLFYRALAKYCKNAVCIDSSLAHNIEGVLRANVIWIETKIEQFGWASHNNIQAAKNDLDVQPAFSAWHNPPSVIRWKKADEIIEEIEWNDELEEKK